MPDAFDLPPPHAAKPLLFDFVIKRRARWRSARLAMRVFQPRRHFDRAG